MEYKDRIRHKRPKSYLTFEQFLSRSEGFSHLMRGSYYGTSVFSKYARAGGILGMVFPVLKPVLEVRYHLSEVHILSPEDVDVKALEKAIRAYHEYRGTFLMHWTIVHPVEEVPYNPSR